MNNFKSTILSQTDTINEAIQVLDNIALGIVMVVDSNGRLVGTITDGDIRRALIKQKPMSTHLAEIMFNNPVTISTKYNHEEIVALMNRNKILQIPILNTNHEVVGLKTLQHLIDVDKKSNPVFLMAGGFGKRLNPLTNDVPKPLLKVGNKPILENILQQFIDFGFCDFYISVHYKAEMIREYFGDGSHWGVKISYVYEEEPLGTAGALGLLPSDLPDLPILMMNGDLLTKVDFDSLLSFHYEYSGIATMCVREYDFQVPFGVVDSIEQKVTSIVEKPTHKFFVNAGVYVLDPALIKSVNSNSYLDMPSLLELQIENGKKVNMFPIHEYWLDIGQMEQFEKAQLDYHNLF